MITKKQTMNNSISITVKCFIITFLLLSTAYIFAQEEDKKEKDKGDLFDNFKREQDAAFANYKDETDKQFEDYEKANEEAFDKFKEDVEKLWGAADFKESTKKNWVEYSSDKKTRTDVDFENGEATVEVLMTPEEAANQQLVEQKISQAVENLASTKGSTKDYTSSVENPEPLSKTPVLQNQLETDKGEKVTELNAREYAQEIVSTQTITKQAVTGKDNQKRVKVVVSLPLAPDNIKIRAEKYIDLINQYARKYDLEQQLVFAIMHTESYFNPKARSHVPAFGLMQLVPKYAGRDAYNYIYKKDILVSANYLYQPKNNIELGTAYLYMLYNRSFRNVQNPVSRLYCSIAAYNTGAGNVSRAFIGTTKLPKAIPVINEKSAEQVYSHLRRYLPYDETKDYIKKVTSRMKAYSEWIED